MGLKSSKSPNNPEFLPFKGHFMSSRHTIGQQNGKMSTFEFDIDMSVIIGVLKILESPDKREFLSLQRPKLHIFG